MTEPLTLAPTDIEGVLRFVDEQRDALYLDARESDDSGRISDHVIDLLQRAGCFRVTADPKIGGLGGGVGAMVRVARGLARWHPSAAWNVVVSNSHIATAQSFAAPPWDADEEPNPDTLFCGVYGSKDARVQRDGDSHLLSGTWTSASNAAHAEWATIDAQHDDLGRVFLIVPMSDLQIRDTWRVIGMRGTASNTLVADGVRVPDGHLLTADVFEKSSRGETLALRLPKPLRTSMGLAAVGLGAAQTLASLIARRGGFTARPALAIMPMGSTNAESFAYAFSSAATRLESAETMLFAVADRLDGWARENDAVTPEQVLLTRTGLSRVVRDVADAVHELSLMCGSATAFEGNDIGMYARDAFVAARHGALAANTGFDLGGELSVRQHATSIPDEFASERASV